MYGSVSGWTKSCLLFVHQFDMRGETPRAEKSSPLVETAWSSGSRPVCPGVVNSCSKLRNQQRCAFTCAIIQGPWDLWGLNYCINLLRFESPRRKFKAILERRRLCSLFARSSSTMFSVQNYFWLVFFFDKKLSVPIIVAVVKVKIVGPFCSRFFFYYLNFHTTSNNCDNLATMSLKSWRCYDLFNEL